MPNVMIIIEVEQQTGHVMLARFRRRQLKHKTHLLGLVHTKRQRQRCDNSAMTLGILFSMKTMELQSILE